MKKFVSGMLAGTILAGTVAFGAQYVADTATFKVLVNGKEFNSDKPIVAIEGSTYLPLKAIGEALGVPVQWNAELKQVEVGNSAPAEKESTNLSADRDGSYENPYKFGDKITVTFFEQGNEEAIGEYDFVLKSLLSPKEMDEIFNCTEYSYDDKRWYLNGEITLRDYKKDGTCNFDNMMDKAMVVTSNNVPCNFYSWYINPSEYKFVELYKGGTTECYIPVQTDEIPTGQSAKYFSITYYSSKDTQTTIWFSLE